MAMTFSDREMKHWQSLILSGKFIAAAYHTRLLCTTGFASAFVRGGDGEHWQSQWHTVIGF